MTYSAIDLAKYMVTYCYKRQMPVSNLKLQKMLYFTWKDFYKETGEAIFVDDICAWQLGPVIPDVYYTFCPYAGTPITKEFSVNLDSSDAETINKIIDQYLPWSASKLVTESHVKGGPWDKVYQDGYGNRDVIPFSLIIQDME